MKHPTGLTALTLFILLYCVCGVFAATDGFEINLKELRPTKPSPAKPQHGSTHHTAQPREAAPPSAPKEGTSIYTVKPGDYLFLILIRQYGLSNEAAERLIPEIMRLNGIKSPKALTVGQKLTIPLAHGKESGPKAISKAEPQPTPAADQTPQASQAHQASTDTVGTERQVTVTAAKPCTLARAVIEQLGLLIARIKPMPNPAAFTAGHAGLKLVVACNLPPDEAYTYSRMLVYHHASLLVFKGDEQPRRVIEELAGQLRLSFHMADPAAPDSLPLTYVFPAEGPYGQNVRLTISAASDSGIPAVR